MPVKDHWHKITDSSNIAGVGIKDGRLHVEFKTGALYRYDTRAENLCCLMSMASSKGQFFQIHIRPLPYAKVTQLARRLHQSAYYQGQRQTGRRQGRLAREEPVMAKASAKNGPVKTVSENGTAKTKGKSEKLAWETGEGSFGSDHNLKVAAHKMEKFEEKFGDAEAVEALKELAKEMRSAVGWKVFGRLLLTGKAAR